MASRSANPDHSPRADRRSAPEAETEETVLVAVVSKPHGLAGELKIEIHSDVAERFEVGRELLLTAGGQPPRRVRIRSFRPIKGGALISLAGIDFRDQAEELRGARLAVERSEVPPAPDGFYYHFDLVGCRCVDERHGDLGEVKDVVEDGGGFLLEVRDQQRTLLVPFVDAFLGVVDVAGRRIEMRLPPGLVETCGSKS